MYQSIVVPIDGSDPSKRALSHAIEIAKKFNSEITIITVASTHHRTPAVENVSKKGTPPATESVKRKAFNLIVDAEEEHHRSVLKEAEAVAKAEGFNVRTVFLRGQPSEEIINFLDENPHDLIVMGSRGLGGMKRLLLGSTSSAVRKCGPPAA